MRKPRDYKAEYKRRIERAFELGYTRTAARGHPKKNELSINQERKIVYRSIVAYRDSTSRQAHERLKDTVFALAERGPGMQAVFIKLAIEAGYSATKAYTLWFSP